MVDHLRERALVDAVEFARARFVDQIKQRGKGVAEVEAPATAVANVEHPLDFLFERLGIVESGLLPAECVPARRLEAALTGRFHRIVGQGCLPGKKAGRLA
jgi:hypothetical protein